MYKTILVPIDVTEDVLTSNALKHAIYLAKMSQAKLMLFHSVPDISKFSISYNYHYELLNSFAEKAVARSKDELKAIAEKWIYRQSRSVILWITARREIKCWQKQKRSMLI